MGLDKEQVVNGLKTLAQDFWAIGNKEEWKALPARVEEVNQFNKTKPKNMETRKLSRRDFLKISGVGSMAAALVACGGVVGEKIVNAVTSTPVKDKKLGIQTDKVQILDKEGLAKDNPFQAQRVSVAENQFGIAIAEALKAKGISDAKIVTEQFTITFPVLGLDGKETNPVYSFVSAINITSAVSYVGRVSIGADGRGSVQSLVPQDISVEGRTRGALTLNGQPVFVYPLSSKEWIALSDAEKLQASVDFYPGGPTGEKLPLPSNKISGLARMVAQTPTPEAVTSTPAPTATQEATATQAPTATSTPRPTSTQTPTNRPPEPSATPKPVEGVPFSEGGINGLRSNTPLPGKEPRFPNSFRAGDCRVNPACDNVGLQFASLDAAESYWRSKYPNAVLKYEYWLFADGGVSKVIVELVSVGK